MAYCPEPPTQQQTCFGWYSNCVRTVWAEKKGKGGNMGISQMVRDSRWVSVSVWTWLNALTVLWSVILCLCLCGWCLALSAPQEFMSDRQQGQTRLNAILTYTEQLSSVVAAERVEAIGAKASAAKDDWRSLMENLQRRETALQVELDIFVDPICEIQTKVS